MRLTVDLDLQKVITSANNRAPLTVLPLKRGDGGTVELQFVRSGIPEALAATSIVTFGIKESGKFDAATFVASATFEDVDDETLVYTGEMNLNTAALNALLEVDGDDSNDLATIDLMAEISWKLPDGLPTSTGRFIARVENDVVRGDEGNPAYAPSLATTPPVNNVYASSEFGTTGANNAIRLTAKAGGTAGNSVSRLMFSSGTAVPGIIVTGSQIAITSAAYGRVQLGYSGGTAPEDSMGSTLDLSPILKYAGIRNGHPSWSEDGTGNGADQFYIYAATTDASPPYVIERNGAGDFAADAVADGLWPTEFDATSGTGTIVLTYLVSSAAEIIALINATSAASALVTAAGVSPSDGTGAVGTVTPANLSGGVTGTPGQIGRELIDDDYLYKAVSVDGNGWPTWKKIALSDL